MSNIKDLPKQLLTYLARIGFHTRKRYSNKRLLFIALAHLGDTIRTLCLAEYLHKQGFHLYAVAKSVPAEVLSMSRLFQEIFVFEPRWSSLHTTWIETLQRAFSFSRWAKNRRFGVSITTHHHPFNSIIAYMCPAKVRIGHNGAGDHLLTEVVRTTVHPATVEGINALAKPLTGEVPTERVPYLHIPEPLIMQIRKLTSYKRPLLVVHPGAGSPVNIWSPDNFGMVIRNLKMPTLVVCSATEKPLAHRVSAVGGDCTVFITSTVNELAAAIASADIFLGNDAGLSHLAVALRKPTVVAFMQRGKKEVWGYSLPYYKGIEVWESPNGRIMDVIKACKEVLGLSDSGQN